MHCKKPCRAPRGRTAEGERERREQTAAREFVTRHKISLLMEFLYFWLRSFSRLLLPRKRATNGRSLRANCFLGSPLNGGGRRTFPPTARAFHLQRISAAGCKLSVGRKEATNPCFRPSSSSSFPKMPPRPINLFQRECGRKAVESARLLSLPPSGHAWRGALWPRYGSLHSCTYGGGGGSGAWANERRVLPLTLDLLTKERKRGEREKEGGILPIDRASTC